MCVLFCENANYNFADFSLGFYWVGCAVAMMLNASLMLKDRSWDSRWRGFCSS